MKEVIVPQDVIQQDQKCVPKRTKNQQKLTNTISDDHLSKYHHGLNDGGGSSQPQKPDLNSEGHDTIDPSMLSHDKVVSQQDDVELENV